MPTHSMLNPKDPKVLEALAKQADITEYWEIGGKQPFDLSHHVECGQNSSLEPLVRPRLAQVEGWLAIEESKRPWPKVFAHRPRYEEDETPKEYRYELREKARQRAVWTRHAEMCVAVLKDMFQ